VQIPPHKHPSSAISLLLHGDIVFADVYRVMNLNTHR
jgi:hypothetical protein